MDGEWRKLEKYFFRKCFSGIYSKRWKLFGLLLEMNYRQVSDSKCISAIYRIKAELLICGISKLGAMKIGNWIALTGVVLIGGFMQNLHGQNLRLIKPVDQSVYLAETAIPVEAAIGNIPLQNPTYLHAWNTLTGWRKLKVGNNPVNLYSPKVNVLAGGNTHLEIVMKQVSGSTNWSKIQIRPGGNGTAPVNLAPYLPVGANLNSWFIMTIPLQAFDPTVPFAALANIEFPYSADAGAWDLAIASIRFTGGNAPYEWFGASKTNNIHDGKGGAGMVFAAWTAGSGTGPYVPNIRVAANGQVILSSVGLPLKGEWIPALTGEYTLVATAGFNGSDFETSAPAIITVGSSGNHLPVIQSMNTIKPLVYPSGVKFSLVFSVTDEDIDPIVTTVSLDGNLIMTTKDTRIVVGLISQITGNHTVSLSCSDGKGEPVLFTESFQILAPIDNEGLGGFTSPVNGSGIIVPDSLSISASIDPSIQENYQYLYITVPGTGYRKLKLGANATSLYTPMADVIGSGNDTLVIEMKDFNGVADWTKILVCPQEITVNPVRLATYWQAGRPLGDGWRRVAVPLNVFSTAINFRSISYLCLPYSQSAGNFILGIREVSFVGSSTPFLWFGPGKTDNIHDGKGAPGQLMAVLREKSGTPGTDPRILVSCNDSVIAVENMLDFSFKYFLEKPGAYSFDLYAETGDGLLYRLKPSAVEGAEAPGTGTTIDLVLKFASKPANISVTKATLKYDKDFAFSLSLDDGLADAYSNAFRFMNGGVVEGNGQSYPGLFYSDGCGNPVPFTGALGWYSVNSSYQDIHINTPGYVTWTRLSEMYQAGWDVMNHSYSHDYGTGTDYAFEIAENQRKIMEKTGIKTSHFVIPSGDLNYIPFAFSAGNKAVYAYKSNFMGSPKGILVNGSLNTADPKIYRRLLFDPDFTVSNISTLADELALLGASGQHYWLNDFTHRVHFGTVSASLRFETFSAYLQHIADQYGIQGDDRVWAASSQEVYEYLVLRDITPIYQEWAGNDLHIRLDISDIPEDFRRHEWTLVVGSVERFTVETANPAVHATWTGNPVKSVVNIVWNPGGSPILKSLQENPESALKAADGNLIPLDIEVYPNPVEDVATVIIPSSGDEDMFWTIRNLAGIEVGSGIIRNLERDRPVIIPIDRNQIKSGFYLFEFRDSVAVKTVKVLIR